MRLFELYEKPGLSTEDFFKKQDEIEQTFNAEAYTAQLDQQRFYRDRNMDKDFVPVFRTARKETEEEHWTNKPYSKERASAGYKGLQNAKRKAGHPDVDKDIEKENPASEVVLPDDTEKDIRDAKKRLGQI